ncbi:hypothetical protein DFJ67_0711 [Asanoa ferruginea]|uniref:Uncharacterized protein n=1 Tax=Asanoa ferruginea TaxID=53367 RepID=A0A3D9ZBI6_9ACTN|nr:hypothetical protein DFJ67_0711 [Asanoa ferruginea]GIF45655.1 hypothetical protein Afe04nite_01940 [Asanoa ferruginea]
MANGIAPDTLPGRHRPSRRQWLGLAVVTAGVAAAAVGVPPLITPHHDPPPAAAPVVPPAASTPVVSPSIARFVPITVEAEDPRNTLSGGAAATECATCRGGARVRYLCIDCRVTVRTTVPVAGRRTVTIVYESDGYRTLKVSVNGAPARTWQVKGADWTTPHSFRFTADLPAGPLRLTLFNDESPAPDVDQVVVS